jgi:hypothetical protein
MASSALKNSRSSRLQAALLLSIAAACLSSCGGGGGGKPMNAASPVSPVSPPVSPPPPPPPPTGPVSSYIPPGVTPTAEDNATAQLMLNNGLYAYARGYEGSGETVAVFGTGVTSNAELVGRLLQGFDADSGQVGNTDDLQPGGHDTEVASVIAAARGNGGVEGVAPLADILPVRIVDQNAVFITNDDGKFAAALTYTTGQGVRITNNSWNASVQVTDFNATSFNAQLPQTLTAYRAYVTAGGVEVFAAGNEGKPEVDLFAGLPLLFPELQKGWVAVGSVDASGALSSFSNACGSAAAFCLVAPGGNVGLVTPTGQIATGSGTSFATPQVAGAEALLLAAFRNLTPQTALQILLQTANKTGIYADSTIYGQGLLDIEMATRPIGTTTVATQSAGSFRAAATGVTLGSAFGLGLATSTARTGVTVQDAYQRGYTIPLGSHVAAGVSDFDGVTRLGAFGRPDEAVWTDGALRLSLIQSADPRLTAPDGAGTKFAGSTEIFGVETRLGFGIDPGRLLDSGRAPVSAQFAGGMLAQGAVSNPYLALIDRAYSGAVATPIAGGTLVAEVASGRPIQRVGFDPQSSETGSTAATMELAYRIGTRATLRGEAGVLQEQAALLGSTGTGASRVGNSRTEFAGITGEVAFGPHLASAAGLHAGLSDTGGRGGSLLQGTSNVSTFAAGLGLVETQALTPNGKWLVGASLPLRATGGNAELVLPTDVDTDGSALFSRVRAGLKADGREVDLQSAWSAPLIGSASFTSGLLFRQQPDNIRTAAAETIAAVRVDMHF